MAKIITSKPEVLWNLKCTLGEGTLWVKEHNSIYFTDIKKKRIHILNLKNKKKETIKVNKEIGFLAHIKNKIFILGLQGELRIVNLKSKKKIKSIIIEKPLKMNRINDGKTDLNGKLWFGTMDNPERNIPNGSIYRHDKKFNLKKFNFGKPEILSINFVLRLNKLNKIRGNDVIKCPIKKLGLSLIKNLHKGIIEKKNMSK